MGLLPILSGIKVAYFPDPTDGFVIAEGVTRWKATMICAAPSFLRGILTAARPEQLKTIRLFVTGAEKTPSELFEKVAKLQGQHKLIEGYGITECAPIISINRPNLERKGWVNLHRISRFARLIPNPAHFCLREKWGSFA